MTFTKIGKKLSLIYYTMSNRKVWVGFVLFYLIALTLSLTSSNKIIECYMIASL